MSERTSLIEFPCRFPIKVMGTASEEFVHAVGLVVRAHDRGFDPASMERRPSRAGNYLSLTCTVNATSQSQLDNLYRDLSSHPLVKVVL